MDYKRIGTLEVDYNCFKEEATLTSPGVALVQSCPPMTLGKTFITPQYYEPENLQNALKYNSISGDFLQGEILPVHFIGTPMYNTDQRLVFREGQFINTELVADPGQNQTQVITFRYQEPLADNYQIARYLDETGQPFATLELVKGLTNTRSLRYVRASDKYTVETDSYLIPGRTQTVRVGFV